MSFTPVYAQSALAPPIALVGGVRSGKSVFAAALSRELHRLNRLAGIAADSHFDEGRYRMAVVDKQFRGVLPGKTHLDEHTKVVYGLYEKEWLSRLLMLYDMAGEIFESDAVFTSTIARERLGAVVFSREAIFLVNPEESDRRSVLGATIRRELWAALNDVLSVFHRHGHLRDLGPDPRQAMVRRDEISWRVHLMHHILRDCDFPFADAVDSADPLGALASDLIKAWFFERRFGPWQEPMGGPDQLDLGWLRNEAHESVVQTDPELLGDLKTLLKDLTEAEGARMTYEQQAERFIRTMRTARNYPDGKLPMRVAVVVGKADRLQRYGRVTQDQLRELTDLSGAGGPERLRDVDWGVRALFSGIGPMEADFVTKMDEHFEQVGWFFASSLGRGTAYEIVPRLRPTHGNQAVEPAGADSYAPEAEPAAAAAAGGGVWTVDWTLEPRVSLTEHGRTPQPMGVLLPLLWLLKGKRP